MENFYIDSETGVVTNAYTFEDFDPSQLPLELIVIVHDNYGDSSNSNSQKTLLTVIHKARDQCVTRVATF